MDLTYPVGNLKNLFQIPTGFILLSEQIIPYSTQLKIPILYFIRSNSWNNF